MKAFYKILISFLVLALLGACRGNQQDKLVGNWEQIPFTDPEALTQKVFWEFYSGDALIVYKTDGELTDSIRYTYNIDGLIFEIFSGVDNVGYLPAASDPRGQYWVDELSKSNFKATKRKHPDGTSDGVYKRVELVKR